MGRLLLDVEGACNSGMGCKVICDGCMPKQEPFHRRLAFDLGDVGIGQLTNSLELGCDCLGHIHYFDATLNNSKGARAAACPRLVLAHHVERRLEARVDLTALARDSMLL
jgi:hypothetical protein